MKSTHSTKISLNVRVGAASLLSSHKTTRFIDIVLRGGWEAKGISRLFIYIEGIQYPISCAGRALSGWRDSHVTVHQPECCFLNADNATQIDNLVVKLFHCSVPDMHANGKLWPLALCMFATLLMHFPEMRSKYPRHELLTILVDKANECDITLKELLEWGKAVKDKFHNSNMEANLNAGETLIPVLLEKIVVLEKVVASNQEVR